MRRPPATRHALWVSTDVRTRGGVASCVRNLLATPLGASWHIRHVATHRDGGVATRVLAFGRGAASFVLALARRPALVHLHMASYGSFVRKALLARIAIAARVPVVLHVHGGEFHLFHDRSPAAVRWWIRRTLADADAVVALGELWRRRLLAIAPDARVVVVPNAVRVVGAAAQPGPGEPVEVVFVGDVSDAKGTFTLLDAWAKASSGAPRNWARLRIAGRGETERAQRRVDELGLGDVVSVLGWIEPAAVAPLLRSAQVLTLPSRAEGQPMVVLEAMAHGLCVVASAVGGVPDLITPGTGILLPPDDVDALAEALRRVIDDPAARSGLGAAALDRVGREFDLDVGWRRFDALYREVAR